MTQLPIKNYPVTWRTRFSRWFASKLYSETKNLTLSALTWDRLPLQGRYTIFHKIINAGFFVVTGERDHCRNAAWKESLRHYPSPSEDPKAWLDPRLDPPSDSLLTEIPTGTDSP